MRVHPNCPIPVIAGSVAGEARRSRGTYPTGRLPASCEGHHPTLPAVCEGCGRTVDALVKLDSSPQRCLECIQEYC